MHGPIRVVNACGLKEIGIYNEIVDIPLPLPKRPKKGNPKTDKKIYLDELEVNNEHT